MTTFWNGSIKLKKKIPTFGKGECVLPPRKGNGTRVPKRYGKASLIWLRVVLSEVVFLDLARSDYFLFQTRRNWSAERNLIQRKFD